MKQTVFPSLDKLVASEFIQLQAFPTVAYLPLHIYLGKPANNPSAPYQLGVGRSYEVASTRCIEKVLAHIFASLYQVKQQGFGLGYTEWEAMTLAYQDAMRRKGFSSDRGERLEIVSWKESYPELRSLCDSIDNLGGEITLYVEKPPNSVAVIGAVVHIEKLSYRFGAVATGTHLREAVMEAVENAVAKIILYTHWEGRKTSSPAPWLLTKQQESVSASGVLSYLSLMERERENEMKQESMRSSLTDPPAVLRLDDVLPDAPPLYVCQYEEEEGREKSNHFWMMPEVGSDFAYKSIMPSGKEHTLLSEQYHENSKIHPIQQVEDFIFSPHAITNEMEQVMKAPYKDYRYARHIYPLEDVKMDRTQDVETSILNRRSSARMQVASLSYRQLSHLLYYSYGVTGKQTNKKSGVEIPLRAAPSGGALYPIDLYLLIERVEGIIPGLYYYHPLLHELQLVSEKVRAREVKAFINHPKRVEEAAITILFSGNFKRNQWKYRERGYRILMLDCGHLGQNLLLLSTSLGLVGHGLMGFVDDALNERLYLNGIDESVLYVMCIGPKQEKAQKGS
nr:McmC [Thermoactinomyces sp.]